MSSEPHEYRLFYRLDDGRYLLAVVKLTSVGVFFASMYPTGEEDQAVSPSLSEDPAMKKPRIVFRHFSGSGPLSIYWYDGPYGDAVEAVKGRGVAWLAPNGELLGVELDDVTWARDEQTSSFPMATSSVVRVARGKVTVRVKQSGRKPRAA